MSIEKLDSVKIKKHNIPYTQLSTSVIQKIKDAESLALWVYLSSLPHDWVIVKEQVKNHFKFGDGKIKKIFSYLNRAKLLSYSRERNPDGTLGMQVIHILCGEEFLDEEPFEAVCEDKSTKNTPSTGSVSEPVVTRGSIIHPVVNQTSGFGALQKKYKNTKEIKEKNYASPILKNSEQKPSPLASVESQSTSYNPNRKGSAERASSLLEEYIRRQHTQ